MITDDNKRAFYFYKENEEDLEFENFDEGFYDELENAFEEAELEDQVDEKLNLNKICNKKLKTFSEIPINRWINVTNLDIIKDKNKPIKEQDIEIPFFQDFENPLNKLKQETEGTLLEPDVKIKSKIIKNNDVKKYMEELGTPQEKCLQQVNLDDKFSKSNKSILRNAFKELSICAASFIDYQIKQSCFSNVENVIKLLMMFYVIMKNPSDFDIKNAIFKNFLDASYDKINGLEYTIGLTKKVIKKQSVEAEKLNLAYNQILSVLEKYARFV